MPCKVPGGVYAFARDGKSAAEVWSAQYGYPGAPEYREFYRDIGFDANYDYIKPYLHPDGVRRSVGIKYHRVTGNVPLSQKQAYDPDEAQKTVQRHAADFLKKRMEQIEAIYQKDTIRPVIVGTYDAELFGHWWFEGPQFLEAVLRQIRQDRLPIQAATASECTEMSGNAPESEPDASSWGEGGYFEPWVNDANDWIYPKINAAAERMVELANRYQSSDITLMERRLLNQAAREILLSQASDWPFLMYIGSHAEYAESRIDEHCKNFTRLAQMLTDRTIDEAVVSQLEKEHNLFANIDFRIFASASAF